MHCVLIVYTEVVYSQEFEGRVETLSSVLGDDYVDEVEPHEEL